MISIIYFSVPFQYIFIPGVFHYLFLAKSISSGS